MKPETPSKSNAVRAETNSGQTDTDPAPDSDSGDYPPLLLAFGPADHAFERAGWEGDEACILGYN